MSIATRDPTHGRSSNGTGTKWRPSAPRFGTRAAPPNGPASRPSIRRNPKLPLATLGVALVLGGALVFALVTMHTATGDEVLTVTHPLPAGSVLSRVGSRDGAALRCDLACADPSRGRGSRDWSLGSGAGCRWQPPRRRRSRFILVAHLGHRRGRPCAPRRAVPTGSHGRCKGRRGSCAFFDRARVVVRDHPSDESSCRDGVRSRLAAIGLHCERDRLARRAFG